MVRILEKVKEFADKAHGNQQRKYSPERYIVHPIRVMEMCAQHNASLPIQAAALLHDVLEDTQVRKEEVYDFLLTIMNELDAKQTLDLVVELTDVYTKDRFPKWNRKKRKAKESERIEQTSGDAQTVKYADIMDNSREIVTQDPEFAAVFLRECRELLKKIRKGNAELYKEAVSLVDQSLDQVPRKFRKERRGRH